MGMATPRIISFTDLERWDVKYFLTKIKSKFPLVSLAEFVTEHNEKIRPYDSPRESFKILGVNNTNGIFHAYDAQGKDIKQPYKKVSAGDFAYNPYRINVGSIGRVPQEHDGAFISPAYVVFSVDKAVVLPEVFWFILKSAFFNQTLRAATAGSVRMNLTYPLLETLKIPIPPLSVQKKIVTYWESAVAEAIQLEDKSKATIDESMRIFIQELGLSMPKNQKSDKLIIGQWKDFDRWSVSYNQAASTIMDLTKGKFPIVELGAILDLVQYGTSEKTNSNGEGVCVIRMNNIVDGDLDISNLKHLKVSKVIEESLKLISGDILINRTNSKELVGKCAVFDKKETYIFASYLIRLRVDPEKADPHFVAFAINGPIGRLQINALSRQIIGQANINSTEIQSLKLPLPNLNVQQKLIKKTMQERLKAASLRAASKELLGKATSGVEQMLLGTRPVEDI
ncbi:MAG: restriction endonuclease subunit S [Acidobacteriota bacterium]|nr:restriction endonuclease subunit S [Acidobacteriota bacterium]